MHIADADALFVEILGQVFGHALGQRGHEHPQALRRNLADLVQKIVNLHLNGPNFDLRINQAGGADHLFGKDTAGLFQLPLRRRGGNEHRLRAHRIPFFELQRAVVHARGQAESVFGQRHLAAEVAFVHAADLRHRDVGFVGKDDGRVGDELKQGGRWLTRLPPRQPARIVFDPGARTRCLQHLEIKVGALFQPLRLQQFALGIQLFQAVKELILDALDRLLQRRPRGDIVGIRIDADLLKAVGLGPRQRIKFHNRFKLFAKEGKAPSPVVKVGGPNLKAVTAHPERAARKCLIVAAVLLRDQFADHGALVINLAHGQILGHRRIGFNRANAIDARHRGHDDHIVALQQRPGGRVAHPVDLFVDLGFFLDIGVGARDIGFGLVVVVVGHKVFDGVIGEEAFEFAV